MRLNFLSLWACATSQGSWDQPRQQINDTFHIQPHRQIQSRRGLFAKLQNHLSTRDIFSSLTQTSPGTGGELWVKASVTTAVAKTQEQTGQLPYTFLYHSKYLELLGRHAQHLSADCSNELSPMVPFSPELCPCVSLATALGTLLYTEAPHCWFLRTNISQSTRNRHSFTLQ